MKILKFSFFTLLLGISCNQENNESPSKLSVMGADLKHYPCSALLADKVIYLQERLWTERMLASSFCLNQDFSEDSDDWTPEEGTFAHMDAQHVLKKGEVFFPYQKPLVESFKKLSANHYLKEHPKRMKKCQGYLDYLKDINEYLSQISSQDFCADLPSSLFNHYQLTRPVCGRNIESSCNTFYKKKGECKDCMTCSLRVPKRDLPEESVSIGDRLEQSYGKFKKFISTDSKRAFLITESVKMPKITPGGTRGYLKKKLAEKRASKKLIEDENIKMSVSCSNIGRANRAVYNMCLQAGIEDCAERRKNIQCHTSEQEFYNEYNPGAEEQDIWIRSMKWKLNGKMSFGLGAFIETIGGQSSTLAYSVVSTVKGTMTITLKSRGMDTPWADDTGARFGKVWIRNSLTGMPETNGGVRLECKFGINKVKTESLEKELAFGGGFPGIVSATVEGSIDYEQEKDHHKVLRSHELLAAGHTSEGIERICQNWLEGHLVGHVQELNFNRLPVPRLKKIVHDVGEKNISCKFDEIEESLLLDKVKIQFFPSVLDFDFSIHAKSRHFGKIYKGKTPTQKVSVKDILAFLEKHKLLTEEQKSKSSKIRVWSVLKMLEHDLLKKEYFLAFLNEVIAEKNNKLVFCGSYETQT